MSQATLEPTREMAVLSRAIEPSNGNWTIEAARSIVAIGLPAADHERLNELAASAREVSYSAGLGRQTAPIFCRPAATTLPPHSC